MMLVMVLAKTSEAIWRIKWREDHYRDNTANKIDEKVAGSDV